MFKYYIQFAEGQNQQAQDLNHKSETLLLASSRSHPNQVYNYQHFHMLREDYQGLFYRKLNAIIQLESLQQVLEQSETMITQLSATFLHQMPANKVMESLENSQYRRESDCGIVLMAREMVLLHGKVRKQWSILRKKAELEHQVNQLVIDKKSLVEEIKIFAAKLTEIGLDNFKESGCVEYQKMLLEQARKYNLTIVISNFMGELKEIIIGKLVSETISNLLKSSEDLKNTVKMVEQLKSLAVPPKNRKELINNLTLYLKQFYSSTVYKQFTQSIMQLTKQYERCKEKSTFLSKKLTEEVENNVSLLKRVCKEISSKNSIIMDHKIDIQILGEQSKLLQQNIWVAEHSMTDYIQKEAEAMLKEYLMQEGKLFKEQITHQELKDSPDYKYFYQQLSCKYKDFLVQRLKKAQEIQKLKDEIEHYNVILASYEKQLKTQLSPNHSQIQTYRTLNEKNVSIKAQDFIKEAFEEFQSWDQSNNQEETAQKKSAVLQPNTCNILNTQGNQPTTQGNQPTTQGNQAAAQGDQASKQERSQASKQERNQQIKQENQLLKLPLNELNSNALSPDRQANRKKQQSCGQMVLRMTALLQRYERKQKFIVNKLVNIGSKGQPSQRKKNGSREFEAKLTRKYLILQPLNEETLAICEKVELAQLKKYTPNYHTATLILEYASCKVLLNFLTFNLDVFVKKMEKVFRRG